jgi:hypothetical protein
MIGYAAPIRSERHRIGRPIVAETRGGVVVDDIDAIKQVQARFLRACDTQDAELVRTTIIDDFYCDTGSGGRGETKGIEDFVIRISSTPALAVHHALLPEIELTSPTTATGIWAVHMFAKQADGTVIDGYGYYNNSYEKVGDSWRLSKLLLTWLHKEIRPGQAVA